MRGTAGFFGFGEGGIVGGERKEKREVRQQVVIREGEEGKVTVELSGQYGSQVG